MRARRCLDPARSRLLGGGADVQGGRLASRAGQDTVGLASHHGAGEAHQEEEVSILSCRGTLRS
eukprot:375182-Prymnesium_polylepis.1